MGDHKTPFELRANFIREHRGGLYPQQNRLRVAFGRVNGLRLETCQEFRGHKTDWQIEFLVFFSALIRWSVLFHPRWWGQRPDISDELHFRLQHLPARPRCFLPKSRIYRGM